ncbi:HAD family hydrolase [Mycoplasma phocoenae]|uniref:HAD family hydrolase n=1 Tax=Mycoplasma phocoenae TaxID=754517 RepID=A0A858U0Y9_9MOLU|nr:HAD family hydrolase [Mycoplasma phocoenae]QJG66754.1 HAD family hydrolase [Mycoplasma phocoenae]
MNFKNLNNFIFDLDGTLLDSSKTINPKTLQTINELRKQGKKFSINTGRTPLIAKKYIEELKPDFPASFCNGAIIYDYQKNEIISKRMINSIDAKKTHDVLVKEKATFIVYTPETVFVRDFIPNGKWIGIMTDTQSKVEDQYKANVKRMDDNFDITKEEVVKIVCIIEEVMGSLENIKKELNNLGDCYPLQSNGAILDIIPKNTDKGTGLLYLANNNIISLEDTCVFGDENNDLPMFKAAKYSACMGQARDVIKDQATFVIGSNNENGIGEFLKTTI